MKNTGPVKTRDGSHTLFSEMAGEHYHSTYGAVQESGHIFIRAGLEGYRKPVEELHVLEIGFGTGLNALLTLMWAEKNRQKVRYLGVEAFPLPEETVKKLNFSSFLGQPESNLLSLHRSRHRKAVTSFFSMELLIRKFQDFFAESNIFDVVFFDAFSPESQPEMWTQEGFAKLFHALSDGGVLVTYSCKGTVKRALKAAGFRIEKLPGPPGKREFLRALAQKTPPAPNF